MTTTQTLCYNCFRQVADPSAPCPHCGFDLGENQQKFPVALRAGTVLNDRYIVGRVLGQGGFGITYVAFDTQLQARVAIKEYMPSEMATRVEGTTVSIMMDTRAEDFTYGAERFQEEARTLAKFIGHPNIAGVSSYFDENDTSYFVMDYIEGVSFKSYIANNGGKVSVDETLNVMIPVLRALTAVHAEGFIHRDVTPDNIYISKDGNVKLLDFGSARYSIGDKSKSLDVILKVGYAPKEQYIRRGRQGPYTDVYSCAACFYAALTGYLPPESLERLDQDTLVPVSQVLPEVPDWLDRAILKGLAVQPEDRFQSAAEFLDAIENQIAVEVPVSGGAPAQPVKKKLNPLIIGGIAAALAVAIGLGAVLGGRGGSGGGGDDERDRRPLLKAEVPYITIQGEQYSTDERNLKLNGMGLTNDDIQDLKYMINLNSLDLRQNDITDLSPLAGLTGLENLQLGNGSDEISDLSPLEGLTNLQYLSLSANLEPVDLSPLRPLVNLQSLTFDGNNSGRNNWITDLSFLVGKDKITQLYLPVGELKSLAGLEDCTSLVDLNLYGDLEIDDLSPISGLTKLQQLHMSRNGGGSSYTGTDLRALSGLTDLRSITLTANNLTSYDGLENADKLEEFNIYHNGGSDVSLLTDISALTGKSKIKSLQLYPGYGADLSPLSGLTGLTELSIYGSDNDYGNLSILSEMTQLTSLTISGSSEVPLNNFKSLSELTNLKSLQIYYGAELKSLEGLENLTELTELRINCGNALFDTTTPLKKLTKLKTLELPYFIYNTGIYVDLSGLSGMTALEELRISMPIKSLEPLSSLTGLKSLHIDDRADSSGNDPGLDMKSLSKLSNVTKLEFYSNRTIDITGMEGMTSLQTAYLSLGTYNNPLKDISALRDLNNLQSLTINGSLDVADRTPVDHIQNVEISW